MKIFSGLSKREEILALQLAKNENYLLWREYKKCCIRDNMIKNQIMRINESTRKKEQRWFNI